MTGMSARWRRCAVRGTRRTPVRFITDNGFDGAFVAWWEAERSTRTFFLVEVAGSAVGMANVKRYDRMPVAGRQSGGWWGYVGNVFVLPAHRKTGVGTTLMERLIAWAWDAG